MGMKTALYRHYDAQGALLYVGASVNPYGRFSQHKCKSKWAYDVRRIEIEWFSCRSEAQDAEKAAIKSERPKYNLLHRYRLTRRKPSASSVLGSIGYMPVAAKLNVPLDEVRQAAQDEVIPCEWFEPLCKLSGRKLPRRFFTFKGTNDVS
jgi:hypothetical protein